MGSWNIGLALFCAASAALVCTLCHGLLTSRFVFQPLHGATGQQGLVATIGLSLFLGEYLRLSQGNEPRWIGPILNTPVALAKDQNFVVTITPIAALVSLLAVLAAAGLLLVMAHSRFGREWRAFSDDPKAAALFGIGRDRIFAQTFALASALAGLSGYITIVSFGDFSFAYATTLGFKALTAAVLGGIGSVPGALLGGVFIGLVESGWSAAFPIVYRDLAVFCILIATLIWRPGGFLGYAALLPRRV
jgi:branched-chain amino acid transport system permease protein